MANAAGKSYAAPLDQWDTWIVAAVAAFDADTSMNTREKWLATLPDEDERAKALWQQARHKHGETLNVLRVFDPPSAGRYARRVLQHPLRCNARR